MCMLCVNMNVACKAQLIHKYKYEYDMYNDDGVSNTYIVYNRK